MAYNISSNKIELYPLGKYKDIIIKAVTSDDVCSELLLGENNPSIAKGYDVYDVLVGDTSLNLSGHIKNRLAMLLTQYETKTYMLIDTYVSEATTTSNKTINIIVEFFTHLSIIDLSNDEKEKYYPMGFMGNRIDVLLDQFCRLFDKKNNLGIGKTLLKPLSPMKIIQPTADYYGKSLILTVVEF